MGLRSVDDWNVKQQVSKLMLLAKCLTGAHLLVESLSTELGIASHLIIAAMHNRASVNSVAIRTVSVVYNHIFDAALQCQKLGSIFFFGELDLHC